MFKLLKQFIIAGEENLGYCCTLSLNGKNCLASEA